MISTHFQKLVLMALVLAFIVVSPMTKAQAMEKTVATKPVTVQSIAILTPEQAKDFGWNQQGIEAAQAVAKKMGIKLIIAQGLGYGNVRSSVREVIADGADLVIAHAGGYNTAAAEIAHETKTPVAIVDQPSLAQEGLIADYTSSGYTASFLAGYLSAKMSRSGIVGIVTSGEPPAWNAQSYAFAQGAQYGKADIQIYYAVIGPAAYSDAAGARRVTETVIATGADIIFGQGNGSSFGMLQAVETRKASDGGKVWFIDVIGDKSSIDKGHLLSSAIWDFKPIFTQLIEDVQSGAFGKKPYRLQLEDNSSSLLKTPHIPAAVWDDVMQIRAKILAGDIVVRESYEAADVHAIIKAVKQ